MLSNSYTDLVATVGDPVGAIEERRFIYAYICSTLFT